MPASNLRETDPAVPAVDAAAPFLSALGVRELAALSPGARQEASGAAEPMLDLVPAAIFACDAEGSLLFFNRRAAELWRRTPQLRDAAENFTAGLSYLSSDGSAFTTDTLPFAVTARQGRSYRGIQVIGVRPDGSRFAANLAVEPLRDPTGVLSGAIAVMLEATTTGGARDDALLAAIGECLGRLNTAGDIIADTTRLVGEYFGADRCAFFEADEGKGGLVVRGGWQRAGLPVTTGTFDTADFIAPEAWRALASGPIAVEDVTAHPFTRDRAAALTARGVRSFIACRGDAARSCHYLLGVAGEQPRGWTPAEAALVQQVAIRVGRCIERIAAEEGLREHQHELQLISAHAPATLSHWDNEHRLIFATHAFAERWNKRPEDFVGKTIAEILGADAFARLEPYVARVLAGETVSFEMGLTYRDIGQRYIQSSYAPDVAPDGRVRGYLAVVVDMTERRRAEMALFESEQRLRMATRTGKVGLWDWDLATNQMTWTESLYEIHGIRPADFDGTAAGAFAFIHPEDRLPVQRAIQSALEHDARFELEVRAIRPGGSISWLFTNAHVIRDAGRPVRMLGATLDITARKTAELALRESEARFRTLASHAPVGIFLTNPAGETIFVNEAWRTIAGVSGDEAHGRAWENAVHPDDRARVAAEWTVAAQSGAASSAEYRFCHADGSVAWVQGNAVPLRDAQGRVGGYIGTIADVTQRKALADALEQKVAERTASLREAIAQMEEFSYSVSHDLRAPLRAMHAYAQVLLDDYGDRLDDAGRNYLDRIRRNSRRMENLTHDVLTYSRVARAEIELRDVNLEALLRDLVAQYAELQPAVADVQLVLPLHRVRGHEAVLGQCLANLLTNAAKFVPLGVRPRIVVRTEINGDSVRTWVEDNGVGIAPEHHSRLFRMFERVPTSLPYEGTGVGLAIVHKAVDKMGGRCGVESDGHSGSRFWVELPRVN